jgi:hypothetical protein
VGRLLCDQQRTLPAAIRHDGRMGIPVLTHTFSCLISRNYNTGK